jgi:hypothetical protein
LKKKCCSGFSIAVMSLLTSLAGLGFYFSMPLQNADVTTSDVIDFNGDGYADLAVGVSSEGVGTIEGAGAVNVIYGSSEGLKATAAGDGTGRTDQFWTQDSPSIDDTAEDDDRFGSSVV